MATRLPFFWSPTQLPYKRSTSNPIFFYIITDHLSFLYVDSSSSGSRSAPADPTSSSTPRFVPMPQHPLPACRHYLLLPRPSTSGSPMFPRTPPKMASKSPTARPPSRTTPKRTVKYVSHQVEHSRMVLTEMLHDGALPVSGLASDFLLDGARSPPLGPREGLTVPKRTHQSFPGGRRRARFPIWRRAWRRW